MSGFPTRPRVRDLARLGQALRIVWTAAPRWATASLVVTALQGVLPVATVWLTKSIVDAVTRGVTSADAEAAFKEVGLLIAIAAVVGLIGVGLRSLATVVDEALSRTVTEHVTDLIHAQSVLVDLEYYENPHYHDTLFRAQQEAPYRPTVMVGHLTSTLQSMVTLASMVGLLLKLHWLVGLIVLVAAIPGGIVRFHYSDRLFAWQKRRTEVEREAYYAHLLLTDSGHAKEVRLFALGEYLRTWYRRLQSRLRHEVISLAKRRSLAESLAGGGAVVAVFAAFAYIAWRAIQGAITVGMMVAYYQAFQTSLGALQGALRGIASLYEDSLFLSFYEEFMALQPRIVTPYRPVPVPRPMREGILVEDVVFRYPDSARLALDRVTLAIRPGQVTALVGPNGSGKTTLVKLLCRLHDPTAGRITLDGVDLRQFDPTELRRQLSVIFQDYAQYQMTARDNIRLGNTLLPSDHQMIEEAARLAGAHEFISRLRHGYDTVLGKWFEEGEELSIGEWQRIALARVFVRDAQILILDEPTSALDPQAEWETFKQIRELARTRAVVLVSHRFSTVRGADHIYLFEQGRIVESGTHDELMALGGYYSSMYRVQTRGYRLPGDQGSATSP